MTESTRKTRSVEERKAALEAELAKLEQKEIGQLTKKYNELSAKIDKLGERRGALNTQLAEIEGRLQVNSQTIAAKIEERAAVFAQLEELGAEIATPEDTAESFSSLELDVVTDGTVNA